jgi:hypothetical protein
MPEDDNIHLVALIFLILNSDHLAGVIVAENLM